MAEKSDAFSFKDGEKMRINRYLSEAGFCSRRSADRLIEQGRVTINGKQAVLGDKADAESEVRVDGKRISYEKKLILLAFNKPCGIECTCEPENPDNIIGFINFESRVFPVGRLDKNSRGLILLTNDGNAANRILKASNFHEKEYVVKVDRPVTEKFLSGMSKGVPVPGTTTRECVLKKTGEREFHITITQGLNRQIRRMCSHFGYNVTDLKRTRIINIRLGGLKSGEVRSCTDEEIKTLFEIIK